MRLPVCAKWLGGDLGSFTGSDGASRSIYNCGFILPGSYESVSAFSTDADTIKSLNGLKEGDSVELVLDFDAKGSKNGPRLSVRVVSAKPLAGSAGNGAAPDPSHDEH